MNTPRMTEKELAEHERRVRISRTKTGWVPEVNTRVRSLKGREARHGTPAYMPNGQVTSAAVPGVRIATHASSPYKSKLEKMYAAHLDLLVKAGEIKRWEYEPIVLRLADGARYRPDFLVILPLGMEAKAQLHEVKGKWTKNKRDGMTHLKWAAQKYGDVFTFRLIEWNGHGFDARYVVQP